MVDRHRIMALVYGYLGYCSKAPLLEEVVEDVCADFERGLVYHTLPEDPLNTWAAAMIHSPTLGSCLTVKPLRGGGSHAMISLALQRIYGGVAGSSSRDRFAVRYDSNQLGSIDCLETLSSLVGVDACRWAVACRMSVHDLIFVLGTRNADCALPISIKVETIGSVFGGIGPDPVVSYKWGTVSRPSDLRAALVETRGDLADIPSGSWSLVLSRGGTDPLTGEQKALATPFAPSLMDLMTSINAARKYWPQLDKAVKGLAVQILTEPETTTSYTRIARYSSSAYTMAHWPRRWPEPG